MQNTLYGTLTPLANVGDHGITTSGKYNEPKPGNKLHAQKIINEVNNSPKYKTGSVKMGEKIVTVVVDVDKVKELMHSKGLPPTTVWRKSKLNRTTFDNAMMSNRVRLRTCEKIADVFGVDVSEIIKEGSRR